MWFCDYLEEWSAEDFLHLAPSDEFYVYSARKPNSQNDIVWAKSAKEIPDEHRFQECPQNAAVIGIFMLFTSNRLMCIITEYGQSWDGEYFRSEVLPVVFELFKKSANVLSSSDVVILYDKAPG